MTLELFSPVLPALFSSHSWPYIIDAALLAHYSKLKYLALVVSVSSHFSLACFQKHLSISATCCTSVVCLQRLVAFCTDHSSVTLLCQWWCRVKMPVVACLVRLAARVQNWFWLVLLIGECNPVNCHTFTCTQFLGNFVRGAWTVLTVCSSSEALLASWLNFLISENCSSTTCLKFS